MRLRLDLAYDGTDFHGWASQPGLRTVQGVLESAIGRVLRLTDSISLTVAGRTDAGVHARGQVCHLDLPGEEDRSAELLRRLRRVLPEDVVVSKVAPAPGGFDARFSATGRSYCYRLISGDGFRDPLQRGHVTWLPKEVNVDLLNAGAEMLIGLRDFAPFCRPREGATTIRTLRSARSTLRHDGVVEIWLEADAFCHSMVRSLVGALTAVGTGQRDLAWLESVAANRSRHSDVQVMPAKGLCLESVAYPAEHLLAERAVAARQHRALDNVL